MGGIRKIAIIDDDEVFHLIIKKQLEMKNLGCEILKFYNGEEALKFFQENKNQNGSLPDLILLDVNMPILDGWGFLEEYKNLSKEIREKTSVYMVTSSVIQSDIDRATENENIVEFVSKPITNDKLVEIFSATN